MRYEIHYDDTAGVFEVFEVQDDRDWIWLAAFDSRREAQDWITKHKAGA